MKSTILLTIALFLLSAPTPDTKTITEMSSGFLVPDHVAGLLVAQDNVKPAIKTDEAKRLVDESENKEIEAFKQTQP